MKKSEVVEGAAEVIRTYGWTKGSFGSDERGYCLMGAASRFMWDHNENASFYIQDVIAVGIPNRGNPILFNDYRAKKVEDVLDVLDRAAKHWRNQGE